MSRSGQPALPLLISSLIRLPGLASPESSIESQESVANILQPNCHSYMEQMILFRAGAVPFLARLITSPHLSIKRPALKCLAGLCFTNRPVSDSVCTTSFNNETVPDILTSLTSRARPVEIQLTAARCLTYLHRSGSLEANDHRIEFKTLPCLARLCTADFDEETRATAAETLAYLAEVGRETVWFDSYKYSQAYFDSHSNAIPPHCRLIRICSDWPLSRTT